MSENIRLLLVEDNPGDVRLIQEYLKDVPMMNVELGVVDTLEETQKVLEEDNIDLVLLDLGLPDSAGLDTVVEVISQNPSVPVVVLTGLADNRHAMEAINVGAQDYLEKNLITTDVLVRSIRYSIQRKQSRMEIEEREEKFRSVFEESAIANSLYDSSGILIESNQAGVELVGAKSKEDLLGFNLFKDPNLPDDVKKRVLSGETVRFVSEFSFDVVKKFSLYNTSKSGTLFLDVLIAPFGKTEKGSVLGYYVQLQDITDQKLAESLVFEEKQRAQSYLDIAGVIIVALDENGNITMMNQRACEILRCLPEDYIGKNWFDSFIPKKQRKEISKFFTQLMRGEISNTKSSEHVVVTQDGEERTIAWNNTLLTESDGRIIGTLSSGEDITELKRAEDELRESEKLYRLLAENTYDCIWKLDLNNEFTYVNQAVFQVFGFTPEEWIGTSLYEHCSPEVMKLISEKMIDAITQGSDETSVTFETRMFRKEGIEIDVEIKGKLILGDDNEPLGFQGTTRDITERKRAEKALRESEERHRMVLSSMSDMIFVLDENNNYLEFYASNQYAPIVPPEGFIGKNVVEILPSEVAQQITEISNRVRETGNREELEYSLMINEEKKWFLAMLDIHQDGESIVTDVRDITLRKRAEDDVKERESKYRTLVSNIPGAVYHCAYDEHWTMFFLSDAFENISGYPASDFIMNKTRSFTSIIHPDDRDFVTDEVTKSVEQQVSYKFEYRIICADGMIRWIREHGQGIPDSEGKTGYLDGIVFDVTKEKLARNEMTRLRDVQKASFELSLALGETLELDKIYKTIYNHIEQLMDTSIFIVSYYDNKTKHITAGYVITEEGPVDAENLPPIPLEDEGMGTQSQVIRSGTPLYLPDLIGALEKTKTEYTLKSGGDVLEGAPSDDGRQRSRSAMYVPLLHANEVIGVMQVQSYNINAYNQEQLDLLSNLANVVSLAVQNAKLFETVGESEDRFRLLVEGTLDGVFIHENMIFLHMNQRMAEMIGKERADLIGTSAIDHWTTESKEIIQEYVRSGSEDIIELDLLREDGSTYRVEAIGKECLYDGKAARIVATRNITEQKKAQLETKQAADTALLYLDIMSHDLRNQLQAVVMASEIMQHMELDVESILALEIITESVDKSDKLINKVLSTRELLSVPLSEFSLKTALENSLESLNEIYEGIEIETKCPRKDSRVIADKFIGQLIFNILENAVEYNERKDRKLWIDVQESGQGYQVSIKDNGQGISDAKKESLFDPSRRFGGVGIHQTIRILQKYRGHISVHDRVASDPTQGAEFRIWFPKVTSTNSLGK